MKYILLILVGLLLSCEKMVVYPVKEVVITIDDAPNFPQNTSKILDVLKKHNVQATLFCIGQYLEESPDLAQRIAKEQTMANHTYDHSDMKSLKSNDITYQLLKTDSIIRKYNSLYNKQNKLFRFPYGSAGKNELDLVYKLGFSTQWWDLDASDWDNNVSVESIMNYYDNNLYNKSDIPVILFHLSDNSVIALDRLLSRFEREGIKVISLQEKLFRK